jgi:hypothetical protein
MDKPLMMTISHQLGKDEAKRRLRNGVGQITAQLTPIANRIDHHWSEDRLSFQMTALGQRIGGHIDVEEGLVRVELRLPGLLGWLGQRIGRRIRRQAALMLEKPREPG